MCWAGWHGDVDTGSYGLGCSWQDIALPVYHANLKLSSCSKLPFCHADSAFMEASLLRGTLTVRIVCWGERSDSSPEPRKSEATDEKGVRVGWRQCNTSDTVLSDIGKPSGPRADLKNKNNLEEAVASFQRLN